MVSCSDVQEFIFMKNNNNIYGTCLDSERLHLNKKGYSKFSLNLYGKYDDGLFSWYS